MVKIGNDWDTLLADEFRKSYYAMLREFLKTEYATGDIYPHMNDIFRALKLTAYRDLRVVILGQDPYHGEGQADGLCFSVKKGTALPPSLRNIYKEMSTDLGCVPPESGDLTHLAEQGVLLLNTTLTVQSGRASSHRGRGWEIFTDKVISLINKKQKPVVFLMWGNHAAEKCRLITGTHHHVLRAPHPSPLSAHRGFFGCRHFSATNALISGSPINWCSG